ncbi:MAG: hypothetical protein V4694_03385 [Pseudomonadota bacterium]
MPVSTSSSTTSVSQSGGEAHVSKSMSSLINTIVSTEQNKNPQQGVEESNKGAQQNEQQSEAKKSDKVEEPNKGVQQNEQQSEAEKSDKDKGKKTDSLLVTMLKSLLKMLGVEIKEEDNEEDKDKDVQKMFDDLMKFLGLDKEKMQGLQSGSMPSADLQTSTPDQNLNPQQSERSKASGGVEESKGAEQQQKSKASPTQGGDDVDSPKPTAASGQNEEEVENKNDKFLTTIIVGAYEKAGKLDSLKEILAQEKDKPENKENSEMQKLIDGFNTQIAEVEKGREQSADKGVQETGVIGGQGAVAIEGLDDVVSTLRGGGIEGDEQSNEDEQEDQLETGLDGITLEEADLTETKSTDTRAPQTASQSNGRGK